MPRLTRTEKFAQLRASLTNDVEDSKSKALETFEQKLNDLQNKSLSVKEEEKVVERDELASFKDRIDEILRPYTREKEEVFSSTEELISKAQEVAELPQEIVKPTIDTDGIFITLPKEEVEKEVFNGDNDSNITHTKVFSQKELEEYIANISKDSKPSVINVIENPGVDEITQEEDNTVPINENLPTIDEFFSTEDIEIDYSHKPEVKETVKETIVPVNEDLPTIDEFFSTDDIDVEESKPDLEKVNELNKKVYDDVNDIVEELSNDKPYDFNVTKESDLLNNESANVHIDTPLVFDNSAVLPVMNPAIDSKEDDGVEVIRYNFKEEPTQPKEEIVEEKPQEEVVVKKERTLDDYINNKYISSENYISDTLAEVNAYNRQEGERLIDDIPVSIIDEVRNHVVPEIKTVEETSDDLDTIEYVNDDLQDNESLEEIMEKYEEKVEPEELEVKKAIDNVIADINVDKVVDDPTLYENTTETTLNKVADFLDEKIEEKNQDDDDISIFIPKKSIESSIYETGSNKIIPEEIIANTKLEDIDVSDSINDDDEFSTTVSLQINKIMQELNSLNTEESIPEDLMDVKKVENVNLDASDYDKKNVPDFISAFFNDDDDDEDEEDFYAHPVKAISQEEYNNDVATEVVEIKNISELDDPVINRTIEETKPFIVEEDADYEEDTTPNTLLNVILIALIIAFLVVFFVIIYYILKARGVI